MRSNLLQAYTQSVCQLDQPGTLRSLGLKDDPKMQKEKGERKTVELKVKAVHRVDRRTDRQMILQIQTDTETGTQPSRIPETCPHFPGASYVLMLRPQLPGPDTCPLRTQARCRVTPGRCFCFLLYSRE